MGHEHDFYWLFSHFWWLLFPLFWALGRMIRLYLEHKRAAQALEVIKAYADQGKDIPPDVVKVLQPQRGVMSVPVASPFRMFTGGFILGAAAIAFTVLLVLKGFLEGDQDVIAGLSFLVVLLSGLSASFLTLGYLRSRDNRLDPP